MDLTIKRGYARIVTVLVTIKRGVVDAVFIGVVDVVPPVDAAVGNEDVRLEQCAAIGRARIHHLCFAVQGIEPCVDPRHVDCSVGLIHCQPWEELRRAEIIVVYLDSGRPVSAAVGGAGYVGVDVCSRGRSRREVRERDVQVAEEGGSRISIDVDRSKPVDASLVLGRRFVVGAERL